MPQQNSHRDYLAEIKACRRDINKAYDGYRREHRTGLDGMSRRNYLDILMSHSQKVVDGHDRMIVLLQDPPFGIDRDRIDSAAMECEQQAGTMSLELRIENTLCGIADGIPGATMRDVEDLREQLREWTQSTGPVLSDRQRESILGGLVGRPSSDDEGSSSGRTSVSRDWRSGAGGVAAGSALIAARMLWDGIGLVLSPMVALGEALSGAGTLTPGKVGVWGGLRLSGGRGREMSNWFGGILLGCQLAGFVMRQRRFWQIAICCYLLSLVLRFFGILPPDRV